MRNSIILFLILTFFVNYSFSQVTFSSKSVLLEKSRADAKTYVDVYSELTNTSSSDTAKIKYKITKVTIPLGWTGVDLCYNEVCISGIKVGDSGNYYIKPKGKDLLKATFGSFEKLGTAELELDLFINKSTTAEKVKLSLKVSESVSSILENTSNVSIYTYNNTLFFENLKGNLHSIDISDLNGRILLQSLVNSNSIDLRDFSKGLYFAHVYDKDGQTIKTLKFLVE